MPGRIYVETEIPSSDGRTSDVKHWDAALEGVSFEDAVIMIYNKIRKAFAPETPIIRLWIDESLYAAIDIHAPEGSPHPGVRIASLRMRMDPWKKDE